jgi:hypothetical protein
MYCRERPGYRVPPIAIAIDSFSERLREVAGMLLALIECRVGWGVVGCQRFLGHRSVCESAHPEAISGPVRNVNPNTWMRFRDPFVIRI